MKAFINWLRSLFKPPTCNKCGSMERAVAAAESEVWSWKNAVNDVMTQRDRAKRMEQQALQDSKSVRETLAAIKAIVESVPAPNAGEK